MIRHISKSVILKNNKVLLQKREDFRIWEIPGGMVEPGESFADAAVREAKEETGLEVKVIRHAADVHHPQRNTTLHIYECAVVGGEIVKQGDETVDVEWFPVNDLPQRRIVTTDKYLEITLAKHPEVIEETMTFPFHLIMLHKIAISLRNLRNRILR